MFVFLFVLFFNGLFGGVEMKVVMVNDFMFVEMEFDNGWIVVDVDWNKYLKKKEIVYSSNEFIVKFFVLFVILKLLLVLKLKLKFLVFDSGNFD